MDTFNILTYNIFCRSSLLFKDAQDERARLIPKAINKYSEDIDCVTIQEVFDESSEKILDKEMKKIGFKYKSNKVAQRIFRNCLFITKRIIEDGGIKTYSRYPIVFQNFTIFKNAESPDKIAGKGVIYTKIDKNGKFYHVFGTHLQAGGKDKTTIGQLKESKKFMDSMKIPKTDPVIFAGDLNISLTSEMSLFKNAEKILDCKNIAIDEETWNPRLNEMQTRSSPEQEDLESGQNRIDHVLISNSHLQPIESRCEFISLRSEEAFNIREIKGKSKCLGICKNLSKYSKSKIALHSLSDHEPRLALFKFNKC